MKISQVQFQFWEKKPSKMQILILRSIQPAVFPVPEVAVLP